jgi:hypothetical protein
MHHNSAKFHHAPFHFFLMWKMKRYTFESEYLKFKLIFLTKTSTYFEEKIAIFKK